MMILDRMDAGGSFTEFYAMGLLEDFVLMGHDGPAHLAISSRKPVLRGMGLYHGKRGHGVSVEFSVRSGPVTLLAYDSNSGRPDEDGDGGRRIGTRADPGHRGIRTRACGSRRVRGNL